MGSQFPHLFRSRFHSTWQKCFSLWMELWPMTGVNNNENKPSPPYVSLCAVFHLFRERRVVTLLHHFHLDMKCFLTPDLFQSQC